MIQDNQPHSEPKGLSAEASARRRAILSGLAKGSAAAAASVPLFSHASRSIVTEWGTQCTMSGNQSAAVSASVQGKQTCAAFHPRHFISVGASIDLNQNTIGLTPLQLKAAVEALKPVAVPIGTEFVGAASTYVKTSASTAREVSPTGWPTVTGGAVATVISVFPSAGTGTRTILAQLYATNNATASGVGETDLAYFLAAYLGAQLSSGIAPPGFVHVPFDGAYVQSQYSTNNASALAFFKLLCVKDNGGRPFP